MNDGATSIAARRSYIRGTRWLTCATLVYNVRIMLQLSSLYSIWFFNSLRSSGAFALESDDVKHVAVALYHVI